MKASFIAPPILLISVLLLGCSDKGTEALPENPSGPPGIIALSFSAPPPEVTSVVARISRSGYATRELVLQITDSAGSAAGTFGGVVAGVWHLTVDARDDQNITRYSGETDVEVRSGMTAHVTLQLLPATGSIDIIVTWGPVSPPTLGLMAYYPFEGNANDASGNGNDATITQASLTADRHGNANSAYWFDGIDDVISIPSSPTLHPASQLTIAFWMRVDSVTGMYSPILHKGGPVTPNLTNREYAVYIMGPHPSYHIEIYAGLYWAGTLHYPVGQWVFVTGIIDKVTHKIRSYVNGVFQYEVNDPNASFFSNEYSLLIGAERETTWPDHGPFRGAIDQLRLYNRALTLNEIQSLFNE